MNGISTKLLALIVVGLALVYGAGLKVDVQDVDASQYASISMEMAQTGHYLLVQHRGADYLDKPPLHFWLSALFFEAFGLHNWSYKLPSFLFSLLAFWATYGFAKLYYNERTARLSALMLAACEALILMNNDVRTDTLLAALVMIATWQLAAYLKTNNWWNLVWGSIAVGGAMLAKGPIGLVVPMLAFGTDWLLKRQWSNIFRWQWLPALIIIGLVLAPMVYGLYQQYGAYGPKFFFYYQSFGRVTGDNPFINSGMGKKPFSPFFFTHTFLWSFIPWSLFTVGTLVTYIVKLFRQRFKIASDDEAITLGGFVLAIIALSFSAYKLPHYIYVVMPYAAVLAAVFADKLLTNEKLNTWRKAFTGFHIFLGIALLAIAILLATYCFKVNNIWVWLVFGLLTIVAGRACFGNSTTRLVVPVTLAFIAANFLLNAGVYPTLLKYQSVNDAGRYYREHGQGHQMVTFRARGKAIDFYAGKILPYTSSFEVMDSLTTVGDYLYTDQDGINILHEHQVPFDTIEHYRHYNVSLISARFLNPETREKLLKDRYLVQLK